MDLTFSQADIDFQMEVRQWIEDNYPQEMRDRKKRSPGGSLRKEDHVYWQQALHTNFCRETRALRARADEMTLESRDFRRGSNEDKRRSTRKT